MKKLFVIIAAAMAVSSCAFSTGSSSNDEGENILSSIIKKQLSNYRGSEKWGEVVTLDKTMAQSFNSIEVEGLAEVKFIQSDTAKITVIGNEEAIKMYSFEVEDQCLEIDANDRKVAGINVPSITVIISNPTLSAIHTEGMGKIDFKTDLITDMLEIHSEGMGDVELAKVKCQGLKIELEGMGSLSAKEINAANGRVQIESEGMGKVSTKTIKCNDLTINLEGAGSVDVKAEANTIYAESEGMGTITLAGKTVKLTKVQEGMGKIDSKKLSVEQMEIK